MVNQTSLVERPSKVAELSTPMQAVSGPLAIMPRSFGEVVQFADLMSRSNFVPGHLRGKPGDCMAVTLQALRWEMDPFMVAGKTYFVKDGSAPGYEAQLIAAVVNTRAPLVGRLEIEWSGDWPNRKCRVTGVFRGDPKAKSREVDATTITTRNSPLWKSDPDQQLAYYALRAWARLFCPEVIMGVYTPDELRTIDPSPDMTDVTPHGTKLAAIMAAADSTEPAAPLAGDAVGPGDGDACSPPAPTVAGADPSPAEGGGEPKKPALSPVPLPGDPAKLGAWLDAVRAQISGIASRDALAALHVAYGPLLAGRSPGAAKADAVHTAFRRRAEELDG